MEETQNEETTFKSLILNHLQRILELSKQEFRGGQTRTVLHGNWKEITIEPDVRRQMSQAIEFLSFLLQPYYDDEMKKKSDEIEKKRKENIKKYGDGKGKFDRDDFRVQKLSLMKDLFENLCIFLQRVEIL